MPRLVARSEESRNNHVDPLEEEKVTLQDDVGWQVPELPHADQYMPETLEWWDTWVKSPQSKVFIGTDWQRLLMLAPMVDAYYRSAILEGNPKVARLDAIRQNECYFGATHHDRLRMRMSVTRPDGSKIVSQKPSIDGPQPGVVDMGAARKKRMTEAS